MSYAYQEIIDIGVQEGLQKGELKHALKAVRQVLGVRFPQNDAALDDLLPRCELDDLDWLHVEALRAKTVKVLRSALEARLTGRG